jgi:hypothetical protein
MIVHSADSAIFQTAVPEPLKRSDVDRDGFLPLQLEQSGIRTLAKSYNVVMAHRHIVSWDGVLPWALT